MRIKLFRGLRQGVIVAVLSLVLFREAAGAQPGTLDMGFHPDPRIAELGDIAAVAVQADGKIVLGFTQNIFTPASHPALVARLNRDGSWDDTFQTAFQPVGQYFLAGGAILSGASFIGVQADNKLVIWPAVGSPVPALTRLQTNGVLDASFDPATVNPNDFAIRQGGGKRLYWQNGEILRENTDGSVDSSFHMDLREYYSGQIIRQSVFAEHSFAVQANGKVVAGTETIVPALNLWSLVRFNPDGSLDKSFTTTDRLQSGGDQGFAPGCNAPIVVVGLQPDGKILAAGKFNSIGGVSWPRLARFYGDPVIVRPVISKPPTNQIVYAGASVVFQVTAVGTEPLGYQWQFRERDLPGATNTTLALQNVGLEQAGEYRVVVSSEALATPSPSAELRVLLAPAGQLDPSFNPGTGADGAVNAMLLLPSGKIFIGGAFNTFNGVARRGVARLLPNGSLDPAFEPGVSMGTNTAALALLALPDGKILVGGDFTSFNGQPRPELARLNEDGSLDATFGWSPAVAGPVTCLAGQPDGKVLVGGRFTYYPFPASRFHNLARINVDHSVDQGFAVQIDWLCRFCSGAKVKTINVGRDNSILVGGQFSHAASTDQDLAYRPSLLPLDINGARLGTINPAVAYVACLDIDCDQPIINSVARLADGRLLLAGHFLNYDVPSPEAPPRSVQLIGQLLPDGKPDPEFRNQDQNLADVSGKPYQANVVAPAPDGKVVVGGHFVTLGGVARQNLARVNADGSPDQSFDAAAGTDGEVTAVIVQPDGDILVAGAFTKVNGVARAGVARLTGSPGEPLRLLRSAGGANGFQVSQFTVAGKHSVLESKDTLEGNVWTAVETVNGNNAVQVLRDPKPSGSKRFYRVRVE